MNSQVYFEKKEINTDSLFDQLKVQEGKARIKTLCLLADQFNLTEAERSITFAREAYDLSERIDDPETDLVAMTAITQAYHHAGNYPEAIRYGLDALAMAKALNDTNAVYRISHSVVISYLYSNNPDLAIRYTHEVLDYLDPWQHPAQMFEKTIRMGWIYMMSGKYDEAIPYFKESDRFRKMTDRVPPLKVALNYTHIIKCYLSTGAYDSTRAYLQNCELYCRQNQVDFSDYALEFKGQYFQLTHQYDSALVCFLEMIATAEMKGNLLDQANNLIGLGEIYRLKDQPEQAMDAFTRAIGCARILADNRLYFLDKSKTFETWYTPEQIVPFYMERVGLKRLITAYQNLYEMHKSTANLAGAIQNLELFIQASDRLRELDKQKDVIEISTRYETERKEQRILLLTSENEVNALKLKQTNFFLFVLGGFIVLIIFMALLLVRQSRMKDLQDKTILKQRLLRAQMNPHFLFNTLTSIQGYMIENDINKASKYLSRFAKLIRSILDSSTMEWLMISKEIETMENYLELQKNRFQDKFDFKIEVDKNIDTEELMIPPMLAQPFIENAIEHGIRHLPGKGDLTVQLSGSPVVQSSYRHAVLPSYSLIRLVITDNGVGRRDSAQLERDQLKDHRPMAITITRERLKILGRGLSRKIRKMIRLEIEDLYDLQGKASGTRVTLIIPAKTS